MSPCFEAIPHRLCNTDHDLDRCPRAVFPSRFFPSAWAQAMPVQQLRAGMHLIQAEVAAAPATRERGLMFREQLAPNAGMLFIFDAPATQCMWMRNTLIPLSVAFIAADGTVANIEDMAPKTEDSHCAVKPVLYALEMDKGWFARRGIKAGMKIEGIPGVR
jgi:uncharacterized membrane protein (UPF0127 family)